MRISWSPRVLLAADAMTTPQRALLLKLIDVYTGYMAADLAEARTAGLIHSVWRDFGGDFGRDILREQLKSVAH
jgi:hypothetical protein